MTAFQGLGRALVDLRRQRNVTAVEVAERAGITKAMLSSYENDKKNPTVPTLEKILDALEMGPADLERAMRRVRRKAGEPGTAPRFGVAERNLLADTLEDLGEVIRDVLVPMLRAQRREPEKGSD